MYPIVSWRRSVNKALVATRAPDGSRSAMSKLGVVALVHVGMTNVIAIG
jgi:hypothetical protein